MSKNGFLCDCNVVHPHLVTKAVEGLPSAELMQELAQFYKIIGDETRCKIIFALKAQELCVCDLANALSMSKSLISHQLAKLLSHGVVKKRRAGKEVYYALDDTHVTEIMETALCHVAHKKVEVEK